MANLKDWTQEECIQAAETTLDEASRRLTPFDGSKHPIETLLLASIAASNLAIAKSQPKRRKTT